MWTAASAPGGAAVTVGLGGAGPGRGGGRGRGGGGGGGGVATSHLAQIARGFSEELARLEDPKAEKPVYNMLSMLAVRFHTAEAVILGQTHSTQPPHRP